MTVKIFLITTLLFLAVSAVTYGFIIMYVPRYYIIEAEKMSVNSVQNDSEKNDAEHNIQYGGISNDKIISFRTEVNSRTRSKSGKMPESFPPLCIRYSCRYLLSQSEPLWLLPCFTQDISPARCSASPKCLKSWRRWISVFSAGKKERMKSGCWPAI